MSEPIDDKIVRGRQINEAQELINLLDSEDVTGFLVCVTVERKDADGTYKRMNHVIPFDWPAKAVFQSLRDLRKTFMDSLSGGK